MARVCQQTLCLVQESFAPGLTGLVGGGASDFTHVRAVGTDYAPTPDVPYSVTPAGDGGVDRMALSGLTIPYTADGLSPEEVYVATGSEIARVDSTGSTSLASGSCGAVTGTSFWGVNVRAPGEAWGLGSGGVICKLSNNTTTLISNWNAPGTLYLYDLYQAPTGETFIAASDGIVHSLDGGALSGVLDETVDYGLVGIDGTSASNVWAVGRNGGVARLDAGSGRFDLVYDAGTDLYDVLVRGDDDVWVAQHGNALLHWDGAGWSTWPMPNLKAASLPLHFIPVPGGFHVTGQWSLAFGDPDRGFLITYAVQDAGY